jgi:predicted nuclease of restriction endonuclease-like (RecB) superfamily
MQLESTLIHEIKSIWLAARQRAYTHVNRALIDAYWQIGQRIVLEEQKGKDRARYGVFLLKELAVRLTRELGKGLDERDLRQMRQFFLCFTEKEKLRPELSWTHYRLLLRVEDPAARAYYANETVEQGWGTRQLERNIQSAYFNRLVSTGASEEASMIQAGNQYSRLTPADLVKDPYIMEFLGAVLAPGFSENDLETALLAQLQHFLLELGKGFAFVGRQIPIRTETKIFYIDLVFYNFILKAFVIIELKTGSLTHQDIGQLDMYVRMFEDLRKIPGDNPTIGIILCADKDETLVKYSVLEENRLLFASRYRMVLPSEEELSRQIEKEKELIHRNTQSDV